MFDVDLIQAEFEWETAAMRWRREIDLPRVRHLIQEHKREMGRDGQSIRLSALREQLKDAEEELQGRRKRYEAHAKTNRPYVERAIIARFIREDESRMERIQKEIAFHNAALFHPEAANRDRITADMIDRAREYPIDNLLDVRRGYALCLFHQDRHPSMYVKNNFAHCFSCGKTADTIDVYRKLHGTSFPEAVRALQ